MVARGEEASMTEGSCRSICWTSHWNRKREDVGLEHLLLREREADSIVLAFDDEHGPFRLCYRLTWDDEWRVRTAELVAATAETSRLLTLHTDGHGHWHYDDGRPIAELEGCLDIDIWPTPFTNSLPLLRKPLSVGERQEFHVAWVYAPELTVHRQHQAYTHLPDGRYLSESLDGSGFKAELPLDDDGIVRDYLNLFQRVG